MKPAGAAGHGAHRHLAALTGIRGIAAWFVVLFHIRVTLAGLVSPVAVAVMDKGYLAVDLFFILSGFVLWYNYAERLGAGGLAGAGQFYARRLARIWPLHAVLLLAVVLLALLLAATGHDISPYPFAELPLHILLVQNWGFTPMLSWNDPAWSISCEWGAYLTFPLVVLTLGRVRLSAAALLALGAALLAALYLLFAVVGARTLGHDVAHFGLPRCLLEFTCGNVICLLRQRWHGLAWPAPVAGGLCLALAAIGIATGMAETLFAPACFAAGLLALAMGHGPVTRALGAAVPTYLGEISYATYLAHFPLFVMFKIAVVHGPPLLTAAQLAAFLLLVLGASVVLHHGVELPAQAWLNARLKGLRQRRLPAPATG